jgi:hypothetical protein
MMTRFTIYLYVSKPNSDANKSKGDLSPVIRSRETLEDLGRD